MRHQWGYAGYETLDKGSVALRRKCKATKKHQRETLLNDALVLNQDAEQKATELVVTNTTTNPDEFMVSVLWRNTF